MCMNFGCNPQINFYHFFCSVDLVIFGLKAFRLSFSGLKHLDTGYLVNATPPTVYPDIFETLQVFCQGLKMCMTLGCNPWIIFVKFLAV